MVRPASPLRDASPTRRVGIVLLVVGFLLLAPIGVGAKHLRRLAAADGDIDLMAPTAEAASFPPRSSSLPAGRADGEQVLPPVDDGASPVSSSKDAGSVDAMADVVLDDLNNGLSRSAELSSNQIGKNGTINTAAGSYYLMIYDGKWGDWQPLTGDFPDNDMRFGCGARVQYESDQRGGDDTAMNAIQFAYCKPGNTNDVKWVRTNEGKWGTWYKEFRCPQGRYIMGAEMQYEDDVGGGDDTAANGLKILCVNPLQLSEQNVVVVHQGIWGLWKGLKKPSGGNSYDFMCGASVEWESDQRGGDDTALNGLRLRMCRYPVPLKMGLLSWNSNSNTYGSSFQRTVIRSVSQEEWNERTKSKTIEVGFSVSGWGGQLSASFSQTLTASSRIGLKEEITDSATYTCPNPCANFMYAWQEISSIKDERDSVVGEVMTCFHYCTIARLVPKCPLASCPRDNSCQQCCRSSATSKTFEVCRYNGTDIVN